MITVDEALSALMAEVTVLPTEVLPFPAANLRFTAETIRAAHDHPLFDQSAVDGYALTWDTTVDAWEVVGEVAAGGEHRNTLAPGTCVRIFTGGMMPPGADTVVMQEKVVRKASRMTHTDERLRQGANVRIRGEQVRAGDAILGAGGKLGAQAVGLLRSVGVESVAVHARPRIAIVVTGSEFASGTDPAPGSIFSSNGEMLLAALQQEGLEGSLLYAPDEVHALKNTLDQAMRENDLVISTGGVSVGDLDLVRPTLEELGTRIVFHKVAQKPGKPMLLGRRNNTLVLGLPGNPRAVLVLFWLYGLPAIRAMQGAARPGLHNEHLPLDKALVVKGDRAEFRAALVQGGRVALLQDQGSHMLASLLGADALAYLPMGTNSFAPDDPVLVYYLPR